MNFHVHSCNVPANCFSQGWPHLCCSSSLWVSAAVYGEFVLGGTAHASLLRLDHILQHMPSDPRSHHNHCGLSGAYSPSSKWPASPLKYTSTVGAKHGMGKEEDFMTASHMGMFVPCTLVCPQASQGQLSSCLSCQVYLKPWESKQVSAGFGIFPESLHLHLPYKVQRMCPLSDGQAILSSLPFSCHPSGYQTMNHRWCIPVLAV